MEEHNRFMSELFRIVNGALRLDIDKVKNYTAFLADKLEKAGDTVSANRLRKMLEESDRQLRPAGIGFTKTLPVDAESRFPIIERVDLKAFSEPPIILSPEQWDTVNEFLSVSKSHIQGLSAAISLLMCGPPGTGKSRLARFIAQELGLELYIARLDGLISSFLGSTSKNIRALFEFAGKNPCILFLDEFDAIAKIRGDTQEMGELKRVVNSFIQNLDTLGPQSIVLAATNHNELLDAAVWRRFGYRLTLSYPSAEQRKEMWKQFLSPMPFKKREVALLIDLSEGFSGSDIHEVSMRLQRRRDSTKTPSTLNDVFKILRNIAIGEGEGRRFLAQIRNSSDREIVRALRERNSKIYSHAAVASLLGVSKATAYRMETEGKIKHA